MNEHDLGSREQKVNTLTDEVIVGKSDALANETPQESKARMEKLANLAIPLLTAETKQKIVNQEKSEHMDRPGFWRATNSTMPAIVPDDEELLKRYLMDVIAWCDEGVIQPLNEKDAKAFADYINEDPPTLSLVLELVKDS